MDNSISSSDDISGSSSFPSSSSSFSFPSSLSDGSSFSLSSSSCRQFSLDDINEATNNFDEERVLGKGGEGKVYLGEIYLEEGKPQKTRVAVKQLNKNSTEFENEIRTVAKIQHPNIVALLGYCNESDEKILIYEYMEKGTLSEYVKKDSSIILSWKQRLNICIGAASGLQHLHKKTDQFRKGIIHRDVKPANILIDENWVAKISDFGMFKLSDAAQNNSTMITTNIKGTRGYFAPEYLLNSRITRKIDVYSFGVVLFEVLCRKDPWDRDDESVYVGENDSGVWAQQNVDAQIKAEVSEDSLTAFTNIIGGSLLYEPHRRPTMDGVVQNLITALKCHESNEIRLPRRLSKNELQIMDPAKAMKRPGGILTVRVMKAMNLKNKNLLGASDPYVKLELTQDTLPSKKTTVKQKNLNPEWNEEFNLVVKDPESQALKLNVFDWQLVGKHDKMGMHVVPLNELTAEEPKVMTLELLNNMDRYDVQNEKSHGQIVLELVYNPFKEVESEGTPETGGLLVVIIHEAQDLEGKHHTNPSVRLRFRGEEKRTMAVKKNRDPRWEEEFEFMLEEPPTNDRLHLEVVSISNTMGLLHPKEALGYVDIYLSDVVSNKKINERYNLIDSKNGTIQVELRWITSS